MDGSHRCTFCLKSSTRNQGQIVLWPSGKCQDLKGIRDSVGSEEKKKHLTEKFLCHKANNEHPTPTQIQLTKSSLDPVKVFPPLPHSQARPCLHNLAYRRSVIHILALVCLKLCGRESNFRNNWRVYADQQGQFWELPHLFYNESLTREFNPSNN